MSRWLFFPSQVAGALQVMTWEMTSGSAANVSYTGLEIIRDKSSELAWSTTSTRLWVGPGGHSGHTGYTGNGFDTGTNCRLSWHNYAISVTVDGGSSVDLNSTWSGGSGGCAQVTGSVYGCCQPSYVNCTSSGATLASGQILVFTVTALP